MTTRTATRVSPAVCMLAVVLALAGCTRTQTAVDLDGVVRVFSGDPSNPVFGRNSDWIALGDTASTSKTTRTADGRAALDVTASGDKAALLRRVDASLLATPFLFWEWIVVDGAADHPVRLVIGLADHAMEPESAFGAALGPAEPPPFSRSLTLVWGASALQRGSLVASGAGANGRPHVRYVARGGRENRGQWWSEHLDLSQLHAAAWPSVDMAQSRIVFAGISVAEGDTGTMRIAGFKLSR